MYCNTCKYKNINNVRLYDYILSECEECGYCSISLNDYKNFINSAIIYNHFLNITIFTIIDTLPKNLQKKYYILLKDLDLDFDNYVKTNNKCRICGEHLFEIKKSNHFSFLFCEYCLNIYFNKKQFKEYIEKRIKFINKFYYLIIIKERFLQLFKKEGKNNVKK